MVSILITDSEVNLHIRSVILPPYYNKFSIPKSIAEGITFVLALNVGIKNMRQNGGIEMSDSLFNLLVRDCISHFVVYVVKS